MAERVRRTWVVGVATCDDVVMLQKQVNAYRSALGDSWDQLPKERQGTTGPHGSIAFTALGERCSLFEEESCTLGIFAGAQMDRGRALITELDAWRDWLSSAGAPSLPAPVVVPHASASVFEAAADAIPLVALAVVLFLFMRK